MAILPLVQLGRYDEALEEQSKMSPVREEPLMRAALRYRKGELRERESILARLRDPRRPAHDASCDEIAKIYAMLGEKELAMQWLERAYERRDFALIFAGVDPAWDPLRHERGFQDLLRRLRITPAARP